MRVLAEVVGGPHDGEVFEINAYDDVVVLDPTDEPPMPIHAFEQADPLGYVSDGVWYFHAVDNGQHVLLYS